MERRKCNIGEIIEDVKRVEKKILDLIEDEAKLCRDAIEIEEALEECCDRKCRSDRNCD